MVALSFALCAPWLSPGHLPHPLCRPCAAGRAFPGAANPCFHTNDLRLFWPPIEETSRSPWGEKGQTFIFQWDVPSHSVSSPLLSPFLPPDWQRGRRGTWATPRVLGLQGPPGESRRGHGWRTPSYGKSSTVNPVQPGNALLLPSAFVVPVRGVCESRWKPVFVAA